MKTCRPLRLALALLALLVPIGSQADGGFFKESTMKEADPTIPHQRAIVAYGNGMQSLTVESGLRGAAGAYGWVIPLPKVPDEVNAESPDRIESAFKRLRPRIQRLTPPNFALLAPLSLILAIVGLTMAYRYRKSASVGSSPLVEVAIAIVFLQFANTGSLLWFLSGPKSEGMRSAAADAGVNVRSYGNVGSYQVDVIQASEGGAAIAWLRSNGFAFDSDDERVFDAYAKDKWCFLVAKIRKEGSEPMAPHPISARFPADKPVYPMRLTGTRTDETRLELIVLADREAVSDKLDTWRCMQNVTFDLPDVKRDPNTGAAIGASRDQFVMTFLRADLDASEMDKDFTFEWKDPEPFEADVFDTDEARLEAVKRGLLAFPLPALVLGWFGAWFGWTSRKWLYLTAVLCLAAALFPGFWLYGNAFVVQGLG